MFSNLFTNLIIIINVIIEDGIVAQATDIDPKKSFKKNREIKNEMNEIIEK